MDGSWIMRIHNFLMLRAMRRIRDLFRSGGMPTLELLGQRVSLWSSKVVRLPIVFPMKVLFLRL